jgi:hypothetical protein
VTAFVVSQAGQPFSELGGSGSLVCRRGTLEAVGPLFAGSEAVNRTYMNPIDAVLHQFDQR